MGSRTRAKKRRYALLPRALTIIPSLLEKLQLRPNDPRFTPAVASGKQARFYMTPVQTRRGSVVWFKANLERSPALTHGLRAEIEVQRLFAAYEQHARPSFDSPSFLSAGRIGSVRWNLRRYWEGTFAGSMDLDFGYTPAFFRSVSPKVMARVLDDVRRMSGFVRRRLSLPHHALGWYRFDFQHYRRHFFGPLLKTGYSPWTRQDVQTMERCLVENRAFLARRAMTFTHGDLYPNNILLLGGKRRLVLFDWELAHWDLPTFDPALVYLLAWRRPAWQRAFRRETDRLLRPTATIQRAWQLTLFSLSVRLAGFCFIRLTGGQPERYPPLRRQDRPTLKRLSQGMNRELDHAYRSLAAITV